MSGSFESAHSAPAPQHPIEAWRAAAIDRRADLLLSCGQHHQAERLSQHAAELRLGGAA
jgi:hypothetical protein